MPCQRTLHSRSRPQRNSPHKRHGLKCPPGTWAWLAFDCPVMSPKLTCRPLRSTAIQQHGFTHNVSSHFPIYPFLPHAGHMACSRCLRRLKNSPKENPRVQPILSAMFGDLEHEMRVRMQSHSDTCGGSIGGAGFEMRSLRHRHSDQMMGLNGPFRTVRPSPNSAPTVVIEADRYGVKHLVTIEIEGRHQNCSLRHVDIKAAMRRGAVVGPHPTVFAVVTLGDVNAASLIRIPRVKRFRRN